MRQRSKFARIFSKVETGEQDKCWNWRGYIDPKGYGRIGDAGRCALAHRTIWELENGPAPAHLVVMHSCDNRRCVNPNHLSLGTIKDNVRDAAKKGRMGISRGERHPNSKLSYSAVQEIRRLKGLGTSGPIVAAQFNITSTTVYDVWKGRTWNRN